MSKKILPTPEELRQLLRYEPETGKLYWKSRPVSMFEDGKYPAERICKSWNNRFSGKEALAAEKDSGHLGGTVFWHPLMAHRVAWAIYYGEWPDQDIDHANCDPRDNRITNIRLSDKSKNGSNRALQSNNTSGYKGVSRSGSRWMARIGFGTERIYLGKFSSAEEAHEAYCRASVKYFGEFSRVN